jgi:uncharacterized protein
MNLHTETHVALEMPEGFFERGLAYSTGRDGHTNLIEAHKWFNIAAARGDKIAAQHREELATEMSREQLAAALRAAREWISCH